MRPPGLVLKLCLLVIFSAECCQCQSTCAFMKQTPYDLRNMPDEPQIAQNLTHCPFNGLYSCCTPKIEAEMEGFARQKIEQFVQSHVVTMRGTLDEFARIFRNHFRDALRSTERQLDRMFQQTYGSFYRDNAKVFADFFDEIDEQFAVDDSSASLKSALGSLFRKVFLTEFSLMNPMRDVSNAERHCMARLQSQLKPFGQIPAKLAIILERMFLGWKFVTSSLEKASELLIRISDKMVLQKECVSKLIAMRQCHVCSGAGPEAKPCMGYCLNVLNGCFAEIAEIEPQWTGLMGTLQLLSNRLKSASNAYHVLAPIPIQISEAIMLFQERGNTISNRILFQCFEPTLRFKRNAEENVLTDRPIVMNSETSANNVNWLSESLDRLYRKGDALKKDMARFNDRLILMKGAWRLLPTAICADGQVAQGSEEQCWNGQTVGSYRKPVVPSGIFHQKNNPEFRDMQMNLSKATFIDERMTLHSLRVQLLNIYDGKAAKASEVEASGLEELNPNPDDEDSFEGSAYSNCDDNTNQALEDVKIQLLEQKWKSASGHLAPLISTAISLFILLRWH
ncbi:unnamed protein product [Bursaphelenchus xylophilus]|uniref:(pine wood nematode) hypothetical protein n=1 Tax=Bursaphelenchus xylophilus TaxID=6326 RepID=A0A1I7S6H8_BURXY|nr:unnamed protein product [Bursaphelenchus xylophilus]CAG9127981.1 unnamed protein product [Bursaphelenchus xylophilus]